MRYEIILAVSTAVLLLSGCATMANLGRHVQAQYVESAIGTAKERASFDMGCSNASGKLLGDVIYPKEGIMEMTIGVTGCGKRATYFVRCQSSVPSRCTSRLDAFFE